MLDAHTFLWIIGSPEFQEWNQVGVGTGRASQEADSLDNAKGDGEHEIPDEDDEESFPEGKEVFLLHRSKERNKELVRAAKQRRLAEDKELRCDVCKFSFSETYGELGEGFIEAHHLFPISELKEETKTKIEDLALVCSNCHRMLHRRRPWLTLEDLKQLLR